MFRDLSRDSRRLLTATLCCFGLFASDGMTSRIQDRWGPESGFPDGPVYAITQGIDGYLWIGTERGLVRFDGETFRLIQNTGSAEAVGPVLGLVADRAGKLWVRPRRPALLLYDSGKFEKPMERLGRPGTTVAATALSHEGQLLAWLLKGEPAGAVLRSDRFETLAAPVGFSRSPVLALAQLPSGEVWVGTRDAGLFRVRGSNSTAVTTGLPDLKVNCLLTSSRGEIWVGTDKGLTQWNGRELTNERVAPLLRKARILALAVDRHNNLWVGTNSNGLVRLEPDGNAVPMNDTDREAVTSLYADREGSIWAGRAGRLERIRIVPFAALNQTRGVAVGPVYADPKGGLWTAPVDGGLLWLNDSTRRNAVAGEIGDDVVLSISGTEDEVWLGRASGTVTHLRFSGTSITHSMTYNRTHGLTGSAVSVVRPGRDGSFWAGTVGSGAFRLDRGRVTAYTHEQGLASNVITAIAHTSDGSTWFGTARGLSQLKESVWRTFSSREQLPSSNVKCLFTDSKGTMWIGTARGLSRRTGKHIESLSALLSDSILGIAEDRVGWLWIATADRVLRVDRDRLTSGSAKSEDFREYGHSDGIAAMEASRRQCAIVSDHLGRIWLASRQGLLVFDPELLLRATAPAAVDVHAVVADGESLPLTDVVRIPPQRRRIRLDFAGLSLTSPERVRFRYRLDGFDRAWSEPVAVREAVYTNLSPGSYTFHVIASNPDGVWNNNDATLRLIVEPAVWQTLWFRTSVVLALACAMVLVYRRKLHQITHQMNIRFEERLAERTRIAQELHDTLLQGFLSASMQLHVATDRLAEDSPAKGQITRVLHLMRQVIDDGRNAVRGLRSSTSQSLDLEEALSRVQEELGRQDVACRVISIGERRSIHPVLRDELYRIGREAIVNAFNHAEASSIEADVEYGQRRLRISVRDNGRGIDAAVLTNGRDGHWGLYGMRERADRIGARLQIWSRPGTGTEVQLDVPGHIAFRSGEKKPGRLSWWYPSRSERQS